MRKQIEDLRAKMREKKIDAYIIPTTDFHGSEYVNDYFKCREFVSGFTGSAGTLVVTADAAALWTDGRYFLQAESELAGSGIALMREGEPGIPEITEWLRQRLTSSAAQTVGFDGRIVSAKFGEKLKDFFHVEAEHDLADEIWAERPELIASEIYPLAPGVTGESSESKLLRVREEMREAGAEAHIITSLEEIAWLFNLRGRDVLHTPVFYAFALVELEKARVYLLNEGEDTKSLFDDDVEIKPYTAIFDELKTLKAKSIMYDENTISYRLAESIPNACESIKCTDPAMRMKAIKNSTEIACTKQAHSRDGAAEVKFMKWLKENVSKEAITEISAADYLWEERRKQGAYDLSFDTIAGYGPHGAIIHYEAAPETNVQLKPEGFLLVDSGGQYEDGTTDITRTIALGPLTKEMKHCYTAVLKAHIALATAEFDADTTGAQLDAAARKPLHAEGLDFKHGTGHGVGHMLSVHEGPNTISPRGKNSYILPGMITSNEPGVYIENKFGIRLENEILCTERKDGRYEFETITFCPFEREAILPELLTETEKAWLNAYHARVYDTLKPLLSTEEQVWLKAAASEI